MKSTTNPFTRFLRQGAADNGFAAFIERWDRLEWVVVGVYRDKIDRAAAEAQYAEVWPWLRRAYPCWQAALRPHWQATRAAGEPTHVDPFALLLEIAAPADIVGDWRAMQHLPAAREAINRYLVDNEKR
jgi:hypothetical protein